MSEPCCRITLTFFESPAPTFTYFCVDQPSPWSVSSDGNICPSTRKRDIEFKLETHPTGGEFIGFKLSTTPGGLKNKNHYFNDTNFKAKQLNPTTIVLNANSTVAPVRVWYATGIRVKGKHHWDDPKIFNPPDD